MAWLSVASNTVLLAAGIACYAIHAADKPADREHPYGHGKIENISGALEAALILGAAIWIIIEAVDKLLPPQPVEYIALGAAIMAVSCSVNFFVARALFRVGRRAHSVALEADAWQLMTDVYTSAGVMVGLFIIGLGEHFAPHLHWPWLDPAAVLLVAGLILRAAWQRTYKATHDLLDRSLPDAEEGWLRAQITRFAAQGVCGLHRLRTRRSGWTRFIDSIRW